MNKTKEKIVIIKTKLCIVNIKILVIANCFCGIHSLKPPKRKMNGYKSFLEYELKKGI